MVEIKTISCHGTSYTEGGGFEWDVKDKSLTLNKFYQETPKTQFNYSWPGQLQKLVKSKVTNYGKSGYGNEKVYRDIHQIYTNPNIVSKNHLFLIEVSQIGRSELFINELNDYCIINYDIKENGESEYHGSANEYFRDSKDIKKKLLLKKKFFWDYIKHTKNRKNLLDTIEKNLDFLVSFLEYNNLNYTFVNTPYILFNIKPSNNNVIKYPSKDKKRLVTDFVDYIKENNFTITDDTNGEITDPHFGFNGNKEIANIIYEQLEKKYKL
jgi:hypothetical protein